MPTPPRGELATDVPPELRPPGHFRKLISEIILAQPPPAVCFAKI